VPNAIQNSVRQRTYHAHCHHNCNNDTHSKAFFGWMWDWPSMQDSINNKREPKFLYEKNANAFIGLHCSLGMSSFLQNPQLTK
jgi:hypothetical protein